MHKMFKTLHHNGLMFTILVLVGHYEHVEEGQRLNPLAEPVPMRQPVIMTLNPYPP